MARGRLITRDVSTSERLADLRTDFARLLWSWSMAYTDRDGRLPGAPRVLLALVVPMLGRSADDVAEAIADLCRTGLAVAYESDGVAVLQLTKFRRHQPGMRYDREGPSKYGPPPEDSGVIESKPAKPGNSGPTPEYSRLSEGKANERKGRGGAAATSGEVDPKSAAMASAIRKHLPVIYDPDETAEVLLGVAPLHAETWWLERSIQDAAAELGSAPTEHDVRRKLRIFIQNTRRAPVVRDHGAKSEAEHLERKKRLAADAKAERRKIEREEANRATPEQIRKITAAVVRPIGA